MGISRTGVQGPALGVVGTPATITANQGSITTLTDVTGLSVTFTAQAGRRYRLSAGGQLSSSVNADGAGITITTSGNTVQKRADAPGMSNAVGLDVVAVVTVVPGAGSITYKVRCERLTGTGNITFGASATNPGFLLAEDIGPA